MLANIDSSSINRKPILYMLLISYGGMVFRIIDMYENVYFFIIHADMSTSATTDNPYI